jgi:hypothetical protein
LRAVSFQTAILLLASTCFPYVFFLLALSIPEPSQLPSDCLDSLNLCLCRRASIRTLGGPAEESGAY